MTEAIGDADDCTTRVQQISYMPTLTSGNHACYDPLVVYGPKLDPVNSEFAKYAKQLAIESAVIDDAECQPKQPTVITKPMMERNGKLNPLAVFNESKGWVSLLQECGFKRRGKRWLPPCSSSGVAGAFISYDVNPEGAYISPHSSDPLNYEQWKPSDKLDVWIAHGLGLDHRDPVSTALALKAFADSHIVQGGITLTKYNQIQHRKNIEQTLDDLVNIKLPEELS